MRLRARLERLRAGRPACGRVTRLADPGEPVGAADRCRRCGGCHVVVVEEVVVGAPPDGLAVAGMDGGTT